MKEKEQLHSLIRFAIKTNEFILSSGKKSNFYFDGRKITLSHQGMPLIGRLINDILPLDIDAIGGPTLGADPMVMATCLIGKLEYGRNLNGFLIRKESKKYGMKKLIEGPELSSNSKVILLEDTITTGGSVLKAAKEVKNMGWKIAQIIILLDREEGGKELLEKEGFKVVSLFKKSDFV